MITIISLFTFCVQAFIVDFWNIDKSIDHFILYTTSQTVQKSFVDSFFQHSLQSSCILCQNQSLCNITSPSSAYIIQNSIKIPYLWGFSSEDFTKFLQKYSSPAIILLNSHSDIESFSLNPISFLFYYDNSDDFNNFTNIAIKYRWWPVFFAGIFNNTLGHKGKFSFPMVKVHGLDSNYYYVAYKDFENFIDKHICPVLLPYNDGIWIKKCLEGKIVAISVINQKRKGIWNLYAGQLKMIGVDLRDEKEDIFQMMYVDSKKYPEFLEDYKIPIVPCVLIEDWRKADRYYLGDFSLKNKKKFLQILYSIKNEKSNPKDFTLELMPVTQTFTLWHAFPLLFLLSGLSILVFICFRMTFSKQKIN
ncbi:hypothetical protein SteCoe_23423 [Stentor coeruleus]|uniref:Thioredoxin domain-containing protein n=1 Tax=Stentor coeruleus TaxID=5963 RepID=A0A1R2BK16_9CILI|nr:hypothetical protein SteCoe_23423 [Stentor coeruleus]